MNFVYIEIKLASKVWHSLVKLWKQETKNKTLELFGLKSPYGLSNEHYFVY